MFMMPPAARPRFAAYVVVSILTSATASTGSEKALPPSVVPRLSAPSMRTPFCCASPPPICAVVATPMVPPPFDCCPLVGITPGARAANDNGLRLSSGRSATGRVLTTVPIPEVCDSSCTALAVTSTLSETVPTCIVTSTVAVRPTVSGICCTLEERNPLFSTVSS